MSDNTPSVVSDGGRVCAAIINLIVRTEVENYVCDSGSTGVTQACVTMWASPAWAPSTLRTDVSSRPSTARVPPLGEPRNTPRRRATCQPSLVPGPSGQTGTNITVN